MYSVIASRIDHPSSVAATRQTSSAHQRYISCTTNSISIRASGRGAAGNGSIGLPGLVSLTMRPGCMPMALVCGGPARRASCGQGGCGSRHETSSHGAETRRMIGPVPWLAAFVLATPSASDTATSVCGCVAACSRAYGAMWLQMRNHRQTVTNARPMMTPDQIGPTADRPPPPLSGWGVRRSQAPSAGPVIVSIRPTE